MSPSRPRHTALPLSTLLALAVLPLASNAAAYTGDGFTSTGWSKVLGFSAHLAGRDLNGTDLNGASLDGRYVEWVHADAGEVNGNDILSLWLEGTRFFGIDAQGHLVAPQKFIGAELVAELDDGSPLSLYVADARRHPDKQLHDVIGYEVWFATLEGWAPLCGLDADGAPVVAIPLAGRWDYGEGTPTGGQHIDDPLALTFACEGYVLAKCVTAGYLPWKKTLQCQKGQGCEHGTLAPHHQTCTRALRADYFGDGTAHTSDGTLISLYDDLGVRDDTESWAFEAEWDENGAVCVDAPRESSNASLIAPLITSSCGDTFAHALLMTETGPLP